MLRECDVDTVGLAAADRDVVPVAEPDEVADDVADRDGFTFVAVASCEGDTVRDSVVDRVTVKRAEAVIEPEYVGDMVSVPPTLSGTVTLFASSTALMDGVCVLERTEDSDSVDVAELDALPESVTVGATEMETEGNEDAVDVPPVSFTSSADCVGGAENDTETRVDTVSVDDARGEKDADASGDDVFAAATVFENDGELVVVLLVVDDAVVVLDCDAHGDTLADGVTEREIDTDAVDERETAGDGLAVDVFDDVVVGDSVVVDAPDADSVQEAD